ncbi:MAG TPA: response regulator [Gaiellaceae bacterium]|nr:response regulator [Gaiellaceae bacterium]
MADGEDDFKARLLATFAAEAEEHLRVLNANLLALGRGLPPDQARATVEATFREMHTLKGASRSVGLTEAEALCKTCESVLSELTQGRRELDAATLRLLQEQVDAVERLVSGSPAPPAPGRPTGAGQPPPAADTVRLDASRLDDLLYQTEDLFLSKLAAEERVRDAETLVEGLARARLELGRDGAGAAGPEAGRGRSVLAPLETEARAMLDRLAQDERRIASAVGRLHDEVRRLRLTPAASVLDAFPRIARELAREQGKEVEWTARGAELEVDRRVLAAIKDPLLHLVRNAVDHGIEPPAVRTAAGKEPRGRVTVTVAAREGGRVEVLVEDDGRGIDPAGVREAALRTRLLSEEQSAQLGDRAALDLLFRSGLSTSRTVTDVSGHGLGLAIVKEQVGRLGGRVELESDPGRGTRVRMLLPATVATFRGVLVEERGRRFLLPVAAVERVLAVSPGELRAVEGRRTIRWNGLAVPLARLGDVLGLPDRDGGAGREDPLVCVVLAAGDERLGLLVEQVEGDREVAVKQLGPPLVRLRHTAEVGLLGTGELVPVLRPEELVRSAPATGAAAPAAPAEPRRPAVLVVDDAITTRVMETTMLEAAGYRVQAAVDGVDAWTALKSGEFDLVVSDVDMPRMNGFELTARIRSDPALADLPVVLVTALESREDRERGIEAGANAYVVKSSFDQSNLLELVQRLV